MPYSLTDTGLTIPTADEILGEMLAEYADPELGFGPEVDVSPDSPFYKLARRYALREALVWQALEDLLGSLDPGSAAGQQLDRLGSLFDLKRRKQKPSQITGRVVGTPGTVIPSGAIVLYEPLATRWSVPPGVIPANGILVVLAVAVEFGPIDARAAGSGDWSIVSGQVLGWDSFDSVEDASLGAYKAEDAEFRPEFFNAAVGLAAYDAIVREVEDTLNVVRVFLYVNEKLTPDPLTGLLGKQMRFIVQGGARLDVAASIHRAVGTPVDTVGAVVTTISPGNGQALDYRFDRLKRRRGYLRLTITGNVKVPFPDDAEAVALAAIAAVPSGDDPTFNPFTFGLAAVTALSAAAPGCVASLVAEGRLSVLDPWQQTPIALALDERIDIATGPTVAEASSTAEDPIVAPGLSTFALEINGLPAVVAVMPAAPTEGSAAIAAALQPQFSGVVIDSNEGRVRIRTAITGSLASLGFPVDTSLNGILGLALFQTTGSDGDAEVVLL